MNKFSLLLEQFVRLLQLVGIPLFGTMFVLGIVILLTSGKNPWRRRLGYIMTITCFFGVLGIAYAPAIVYMYENEVPIYLAKYKTVNTMVDGSTTVGNLLFKGLWYATVPICATIFYVGGIIRLQAAKNPQRTRLGWGLMMFSPIVLGVAYVVPSLLSLL